MRNLSDKRLRTLLVASLATNLFFVGLVSAGMVFGPGFLGFGADGKARGYRDVPPPRALRAVLPESDQELLETTLDQHRDNVRGHFRELIDARQGVADAVRAEPFDAGGLDAALAELRRRDSGTAEAIHRMLSSLIGRLDDASRAKVADTIRISRRHDREERERDGENRR